MLLIGLMNNWSEFISGIAMVHWTFLVCRWWYRKKHPKPTVSD